MTTSDIFESLVKDSIDIGCSEALQSTALDDSVGVHLSTMTTTSTLPPALPLRTRVNGRKEGTTRKARAPSPEADTAERKGDSSDDFASPPPIPPRLPPRANSSSGQRFPGRPVHDPRSSGIFLLLTPAGRHLSGAELLRSRPPLLPRDVVVTGAPAVLTLQSVAQASRCRSNAEEEEARSHPPHSDSDLVWWSSGERQLTHYPVSALSAITNTGQLSSRSRKMNDYVDSPIALHSNAQAAVNGLETVENLINSEAPDASFHHHLWPTPSVVASPSSTNIKSGSESSAEKTTQCRQRVTCARCGKCRCKQCTVARPLPRCWAGECECSAQSAVDCCTCMCCARALFYHCRTTEDNDFSDDPCACMEQRDCCKRWTLLTLLSLCLPCLCLYCPLVGAVSLCTACYNRRRNSRGCCCCDDERCRTEASKGLLIESESSSS